MLVWASEQPTEITTTAIDLEFLPTDTNEDRGVQNLEFLLQQMHTALMALTIYEANDIVANSWKNPLEAWRRLQKLYDPTTGGRKRNLLRTIISPGRCSLLELQAVIEHWESYVSRYEKKLKDKCNLEYGVVARPMELLHHSGRPFEVSADSFHGKPVLTAGPCHVLADAFGRKQKIRPIPCKAVQPCCQSSKSMSFSVVHFRAFNSEMTLFVSLIWLVLQSCSCPADDSIENSNFFRLSSIRSQHFHLQFISFFTASPSHATCLALATTVKSSPGRSSGHVWIDA